jgi:hypothetical protein
MLMQEAEEESSESAPAIPPLPERLSVKANAEVEAEVRAKIAQAQVLLEEAVAAGNGGGAGGQGHGQGGWGGGNVGDERVDLFSASAPARTVLGRALLGGEFLAQDVVRGRRLLEEAVSAGEVNAAR